MVLDAGARAAKVKLAPEVERAEVEREIRTVIEQWVAAQNRGDFAAYTALYDQAHFRGQKRTKTGKTTRADWAAWRDDRAKMFDKGVMTVAVDELTIRTWLDPGATLRPGVSEARFVQRWRNPRYADHGVKILQFLRTRGEPAGFAGRAPSQTTGTAILYEDMLTSSPGWQEPATVDAGQDFELGDVPVPKTDDDAMALWRKLELTEETVRSGTYAIADFAGADLMAEALLRQGSFACKRYVAYDECGESSIEWQDIPPETGWDDACVQRTAAEWAIEQVKAKRLPALAEVLVKLAGLPPPEERIAEALVARFSDMPEKLRLAVVRAMLAARCDKRGCDDWHPERLVTKLSAKSRIVLYQDGELATAARWAAIDGVDLSRHPDVLVELYGDDDLDGELREKFEDVLAAQKPAVRERALRAAAADPRCAFAMSAIDDLAGLGKKDLVPRAGQDEPGRVVCLLLHARDQDWAEREFRKLLPKRGKIVFTEESTDEMAGPDGHQRSEQKLPARDVSLGQLPAALGARSDSTETYDAGHVDKAGLEFDANGLLIKVWKTSWSGCPC